MHFFLYICTNALIFKLKLQFLLFLKYVFYVISISFKKHPFEIYGEFHFRWLNAKGFDAAFLISVTQFFDYLN